MASHVGSVCVGSVGSARERLRAEHAVFRGGLGRTRPFGHPHAPVVPVFGAGLRSWARWAGAGAARRRSR
jgi:hypothetical protein